MKPHVSYLCVQLTDLCVGETVQAARILFSITVVCSQLEGMNTVNRQGNVYSGTCCSVELTQNSLIQISYKWTDGSGFFFIYRYLKPDFFFRNLTCSVLPKITKVVYFMPIEGECLLLFSLRLFQQQVRLPLQIIFMLTWLTALKRSITLLCVTLTGGRGCNC